jgi:hypothetical protein
MKPISEQEQRILDVLMHEQKIPKGHFIIDEDHLISFMHAYVNILNKSKHTLDSSNYRYARKLAALTLMKHLNKLGSNASVQPSGFVYIIENPSFPDHYKIGMTVDMETRLKSYQTYDPYRKFSIVKYEFVLNRRHIEEQILNSFSISLENGEWVKKNPDNGNAKVEDIFRDITTVYDKIHT